MNIYEGWHVPDDTHSRGVSPGIKMSDATLHDAYTPTARKADAMKLICLSREIVRLDSRGGTWDLGSQSVSGWLVDSLW